MSMNTTTANQGTPNVVRSFSDAAADGKITGQEQSDIIKSARTNSGALDPQAVADIERLAQQAQALATTLRQTLKSEAIEVVELASFPVAREELDEKIIDVAREKMQSALPLSMSQGVTIRGARRMVSGGYQVLVAVHDFMSAGSFNDRHYVLAAFSAGSSTEPREVSVLVPLREPESARSWFERAISLLNENMAQLPGCAGEILEFSYIQPEMCPAIGVRANAARGDDFDEVRERIEEAVATFLEAKGFANLVTRNYMGNMIVVIPQGGGWPM